jgi:hypothetical protein
MSRYDLAHIGFFETGKAPKGRAHPQGLKRNQSDRHSNLPVGSTYQPDLAESSEKT